MNNQDKSVVTIKEYEILWARYRALDQIFANNVQDLVNVRADNITLNERVKDLQYNLQRHAEANAKLVADLDNEQKKILELTQIPTKKKTK